MQAPLKKKSEQKILILCLMDKVGYPLDYVSLNDIATVDGLITGFEFAECFSELVDAGNIRLFEAGEGDSFVISEQGKHIVNELGGTLLHSVREQAYKSALNLLDFRRSGYMVEYSTARNEHGKPTFTCTIKQGNAIKLQTTISLETDEQLDRAVYNWNKNPENIYKGVLALLSGDVDYLFN